MFQAPTWSETELFDLFDLSILDEEGVEAWLGSTLNRCAAWFRASGASVFLADEFGSYRLRAKAGAQSQVPSGAMIRPGEGIAGAVLADGKPKIVGDPGRDPQLSGSHVSRKSGIASSMVVPLVSTAAERLGVLNLSRGPGETPFLPADLEQAATLGRHVAMAVANARLIDLTRQALAEQRKKAEQLQAVLASVAGQVTVFDARARLHDTSGIHPVALQLARRLAEQVAAYPAPLQDHAFDREADRVWAVHAVPLSDGGGVLTVQDVTEFHRARSESDRLRRLAEIGQMTAAVAHEIRNPLTGIGAAAQIVCTDPDAAPTCGQIIVEEVGKLEALCSEFLELARPMKLAPKLCDLAEPVRRAVEMCRSQFEEKGVRISFETGGKRPMIQLDVRRVEQVAHNLVRNALQASAPGGTVWVRVRGASFEVEDDGVGIDQETIDKLFAPFFTTKPGGTGLGLCNSRRVVDAHGGSITVASEPGEGTVFTVTFLEGGR
ncbi:MAG: GAF domain-containing protein [Fimbriimonadaceae bacterium]|nr:GAF domain-containing protein [Fimbriimonadaceae bacterium]QYK57069.1 MAG: GAF domain-containing protein [Fimbriimonadaceae bacterium]